MPLGEFVVAVPQHPVYIREETLCSCVDMSCVPALVSLPFLKTSNRARSFCGGGAPSRPLKCQLSNLHDPELTVRELLSWLGKRDDDFEHKHGSLC